MNAITLNSGHDMPQLGFGVFKVPNDETERAVTLALQAGYRSIDTAAMYGNEEGVAAAIREAGLPREDLFITTKLDNDAHGFEDAIEAFEASRKRLGLEYLDLYLIHWPQPAHDRYVDTWRAMIKLREDGLIRSIGVSNFQTSHLQRVIDETDVVPALNQVELHPYLTQPALQDYHHAHGIVTEAWSPIGRGGELLRDAVITSLADKYGKTPAQIVIRWHLDIGNVVIPKSVTPDRIVENFEVEDFELDADDIRAIGALDRDGRIGPHPDAVNP